ncbi:MAG: spore coat protein CotJB [Chloroflexota bacterium]
MLALQALGFTLVDLNLYLDTHPWDQRALADFNATSAQYHACRQQYESMYGPLMNFGHSMSPAPWRWAIDPWPWEICV